MSWIYFFRVWGWGFHALQESFCLILAVVCLKDSMIIIPHLFMHQVFAIILLEFKQVVIFIAHFLPGNGVDCKSVEWHHMTTLVMAYCIETLPDRFKILTLSFHALGASTLPQCPMGVISIKDYYQICKLLCSFTRKKKQFTPEISIWMFVSRAVI